MRLFEIILFVLVIVSIFTIKKQKINTITSIVMIITFILHMIFEHLRWSLYPLYTVIFILVVLSLFRKPLKFKQLYKKYMVLFLFFTVLSLALCVIFPVEKMLKPTGPYKIGTVTYDVTDSSRKELYTETPNDLREIKYKIWYPAMNTSGLKKSPWLEDGVIEAKGISKMLNFPPFVLSQLAYIHSNSYPNAEMNNAQTQYPVVVISHGWTGFREIHADTAEMLASHGYIVVSIDHTYGSAVTVFKDGKVAYLNRNALPDRTTTPNFLNYADTLVKTYSDDIIFTLNQIELLNQNDPQFKGRMDLSNIGILGHSTGGGASVRTALKETRIKALVGLDAWVEPVSEKEVEQGLTIPSLFFRSAQWENGLNNPHLFTLLQNSKDPLLLQIRGSKHVDFSMAYMFSPLSKTLGMTGELDGKKSAKIQQDFILNFFNENLKNQQVNYQQIESKYQDVSVINYK